MSNGETIMALYFAGIKSGKVLYYKNIFYLGIHEYQKESNYLRYCQTG